MRVNRVGIFFSGEGEVDLVVRLGIRLLRKVYVSVVRVANGLFFFLFLRVMNKCSVRCY